MLSRNTGFISSIYNNGAAILFHKMGCDSYIFYKLRRKEHLFAIC